MEKNIVFYDARCPLCSNVKKVMQLLDWKKRISWLAVQEMEATPYAFLLSRDVYNQIYMVTSDNRILAGFRTIRKLLFELPLTRLISLPLFLPFMYKLFQPLYMYVSRHRHKWFGQYSEPHLD